MSDKAINFVIGLFFLIVFVLFLLKNGQNLAKYICNKVYENKYNFIVIRKVEEIMNNGQLKLKCVDINVDSSFIFYPDDIIPYNLLYYQVKEGDTLIKSNNSNIFMILNSEKRDSFVFNCKD